MLGIAALHVTPLHFGPRERRLFGMLHRPEPGSIVRPGVLLAMPFGHEAIRTHRLHRVLADRLARRGHCVLRYDWYGTGDSGGDDADVRLAGWRDDLLTAHGVLADHSQAEPACWVASRLGATVALQVLAGTPGAPGRTASGPTPQLVLWDPVVDGRGYVEELRQQHVQALQNSYSLPSKAWRTRLADPEAYLDEAIGFAIPASLRQEMLGVDANGLKLQAAARVAAVLSPGAKAAAAWAGAQVAALELLPLTADFDWTSDDSLNTALVPNDVLAKLLKAIDGS